MNYLKKTKMLSEISFFTGIKELLSQNNILSISGKSGTGKTALVLQLVGNLLTYEELYTQSCIWIQANESFPVKRLRQIFADYPEKRDYINENIFIIPQYNPIPTYLEQASILQQIISPSTFLPPSLKFIVFDNISHHLRFEITQYANLNCLILLDSFYETQLLPLILFCKRNDIVLILIHEVTYSPSQERVRPFFYKLYDRIETIDVVLSNVCNSEKKNMFISFNRSQWNFQFLIVNNGISIL